MSLARHHRDRILAAKTAASPDMGGGLVVTLDDNASPADRAQATIAMRLTHDLRRLKEIQSIQLKIAAKRAGLSPAVSAHWLRHAHVSHALDRGAPAHLVQATVGHASLATTSRYAHARPSDSSSRYLPG